MHAYSLVVCLQNLSRTELTALICSFSHVQTYDVAFFILYKLMIRKDNIFIPFRCCIVCWFSQTIYTSCLFESWWLIWQRESTFRSLRCIVHNIIDHWQQILQSDWSKAGTLYLPNPVTSYTRPLIQILMWSKTGLCIIL